jgi:predicted O-methyltransferase YrrM
VKRPLLHRLSSLRAHLETLSGLRSRGFFVQYDHAASVPGRIEPYPAVEALLRACHDGIAAFLAEMAGHLPTFEALHAGGQLNWKSPMFSPLDIMAAYTMVRRLAPARILEIGSGNSTRVLARALADAGHGRLTCIDPAPRQPIGDLDAEHHRRTLEPADVALAADLCSYDVLFIDSSHIILPGMDVDILFNRIFPRLRPEVFVHLHDIFLPDDYPANWRSRHYSEQNALIGWLVSGYFEIVYSGHYAITRQSGSVEQLFYDFAPVRRNKAAGSLWLKRSGTPTQSVEDRL